MQFVPLWTSVLRSRKVANLSESLRWTWIACLLVAQEHDHQHGTLPNVDDMSYALHMEPDELMSRLSRLSRAGFIEERDGAYSIHDWDDWKHRPDPTAAARKRAQREREKQRAKELAEKEGGVDPSENVTVTGVTSEMSRCHAPTYLNSNNNNTHPPTPRDGGSVCAGEDLEPFEPEPEAPVVAWTREQYRVMEKAVRWWGASCGDSVVGDLLRTYPAALVDEAIDSHRGKVGGAIHPGRLTGLCRTMFDEGRWQPRKGGRFGKGGDVPPPTTRTYGIIAGP